MSASAIAWSRLKAEDKGERVVYGAHFADVQPPDGRAEPLRIDDGRLLDDDSRRLSIKADGRTEARRPGARGRGCDERCREVEELVGLHNHGVPGPALLMSPRITGRWQTEDLSADHSQPALVGASSAISSRMRRISSLSLSSAATC